MENKDLNVSLGCGNRKKKGFVGIDIRKFPDVDYVMNIGKEKMPFEDDTVDSLQADHLFEHFYPEELYFCIEECWRVLKPKGHLHISVPKAGTPAYYIHPDHKIQFVEDTFSAFQVPADGKDPHGYLKHFWHVELPENDYDQSVVVYMHPNKPNGNYDYKEIKLLGEW